MKTFKIAWKFYRKWFVSGLIVLLLGIVATVFSLLMPQFSRLIIDFVFIGDTSAQTSLNGVWAAMLDGRFGEIGTWQLLIWLCSFFLGCILVKNLITYFKNVYWDDYSQNYGKEIRAYSFSVFMERSKVLSEGETFVQLTNDVTSFKNLFVFYIPYCLDNFFVIAISTAFIFVINSSLGWLLLACLPFVILICIIFTRKSYKILENSREAYSMLSYSAQESLDASKNLRSFDSAGPIIKRFSETNQKYFNIKQKEVLITASYFFWLGVFKSVAYAAMIVAGIIFAANGTISTGEFVSFIAYSLIIFLELVKLFKNAFDVEITHVSACRFTKFLHEKNRAISPKAKSIINRPPDISIEKLKITYNGKELISTIGLEIPYGKHVAIVGQQGTGKTMLAQALLRFIDADSGGILINGLDIKEINADDLRAQFSYVPQEPFLFSDTVKENIMLASPTSSEAKMQSAIKIVQLGRWISKIKNGVNFVIPENGVGVPNQEKQQISFARAIFKDAPILLLDSPFAVFPPLQAKELRKNIFEFYENRTIILITNHPLEAMECDTILMIEKGKIVEQGSPQELMEKNGKFAEFTKKVVSETDEELDI